MKAMIQLSNFMTNGKATHWLSTNGFPLLDMDSRNPGVAARLLGIFEIWPRLDRERRNMIKAQLSRVIASKPSKNVLEIATKALGA